MTYKALKNFIGVGVKARKGAIIEIDNAACAKALIEGGFVEDLNDDKPTEVVSPEEPTEDKPKRTRKPRAKNTEV